MWLFVRVYVSYEKDSVSLKNKGCCCCGAQGPKQQSSKQSAGRSGGKVHSRFNHTYKNPGLHNVRPKNQVYMYTKKEQLDGYCAIYFNQLCESVSNSAMAGVCACA